jgi:hypothetical protein
MNHWSELVIVTSLLRYFHRHNLDMADIFKILYVDLQDSLFSNIWSKLLPSPSIGCGTLSELFPNPADPRSWWKVRYYFTWVIFFNTIVSLHLNGTQSILHLPDGFCSWPGRTTDLLSCWCTRECAGSSRHSEHWQWGPSEVFDFSWDRLGCTVSDIIYI